MDETEETMYRDSVLNMCRLRGHYDDQLRGGVESDYERLKLKGKISLVRVILKFMQELSEDMDA